jgi:AraC-like DNA-binding protein
MTTESVDFLSNILDGARLRSWNVEEAGLTAPWGIRADGGPARFYCLLQGDCRLEIEGVEPVVNLDAGDFVIVMPERGHCLRDSSHSPTVTIDKIFESDKTRPHCGIVFGGGGDPTKLLCGYFLFDEHGADVLKALLPPYIHLKGLNGKAVPWLAETLRLMLGEFRWSQPGKQAIVDHLGQIILILAIRSCVSVQTDGCGRMYPALMDPDIGPILELMRSQPELPWTVNSLAERMCLSRSAFAARFKSLMSKPPMQYLLDCRMQKACVLLSEDNHGLKEIAARVGYATEAAFSSAFKRWNGKAPGAFRRIARNDAQRSDRDA